MHATPSVTAVGTSSGFGGFSGTETSTLNYYMHIAHQHEIELLKHRDYASNQVDLHDLFHQGILLHRSEFTCFKCHKITPLCKIKRSALAAPSALTN